MELPLNGGVFDSERDALYDYDEAAHKEITEHKPWVKDPNYFKSVRISAVALVKMVMHARSGGSLEVMGLMQGYPEGTSLVVTDAFRLPVEGTETRVNAQDEANEYIVSYLSACREEGRMENVVGWYHSHPGYGCWLSGIDVGTQEMQQQYGDPFVAVVVDPLRTVSANMVDIGAFRTYPSGYKPPQQHAEGSIAGGAAAASPSGVQAETGDTKMVPTHKASDFGAHSHRYYALEVRHFKGTLDARLLGLLWNKYWVQTLSQNPLLANRDYDTGQLVDLGNKVKEAATLVARSGRTGQGAGSGAAGKAVDQAIEKAVQEAKLVSVKEVSGLAAAEVKTKIFSSGEESRTADS
ncbi:hypothetical protein VTK73DRAFT_2059 [Phialemonium thermophilum]|uniref:COP9 signalosome complex subunit 5 n=1 Tax=Phialemonium thermophilum TaxID=223376 RepID=A0ABR3X6U6_9PEZI